MNQVILKNTTESTITISDIDVQILQNDTSQLNWEDVALIGNSDQLITYIDQGSIIVNDGEVDLSVVDAKNYLSLKVDLSDYYTSNDVDSLLSGKSDAGHAHNDAYYTESEIDSLLANIEAYGIKGSVDFYNDLPAGSEGDVYIVRYTDGSNNEGFYKYTGTSWNWLAANTGSQFHNDLSGLDSGDYQHLTQSEYSSLTDGNTTGLHDHDGRYYTKSEVDSLLSGKSDTNHIHDNRYYTEGEIDNQFDQVDYQFVSGNDSNTDVSGSQLEQLTNGSNADSLHSHSCDDDDDDDDGGGSGSLDDAYGSWGNGRTIDVNHGPVDLQARNGHSPLRLQPVSYVPDQWLNAGHICVYDTEMFLYDEQRSSWLSVSSYTFGGAVNSHNVNGYLKVWNGSQMNDDMGWTAPWDGMVVSMSFSNYSSDSSGELVIKANGNTLSGGSLWFDGKSDYNSFVEISFNQGDVLQLYVQNTSGGQRPDRPMCWVAIKRRI